LGPFYGAQSRPATTVAPAKRRLTNFGAAVTAHEEDFVEGDGFGSFFHGAVDFDAGPPLVTLNCVPLSSIIAYISVSGALAKFLKLH